MYTFRFLFSSSIDMKKKKKIQAQFLRYVDFFRSQHMYT